MCVSATILASVTTYNTSTVMWFLHDIDLPHLATLHAKLALHQLIAYVHYSTE